MRKKKKARWATDLSLSPPSSSTSFSSSSSSAAAADAEEGDDRLTELPDVIRLHILSLLPLKYAIRTGALSSRWCGLWRHRWPHPAALDLSPPTQLVDSAAADDFSAGVDRRLSAHGRGRRIDALSISLPAGRRYDADIKRWLELAASCGVEDLRLVVSPPFLAATSGRPGRRLRRYDRAAVSSVFFHSICECSSLARLTLFGLHLSSPGANFKRLSSLEFLSLHAAHVTDAALRRIVGACPLLRSLDLRHCRKLRRITITANSRLTSVTIVDCSRALEVTMSAPGLQCFKFSGNYLTSYSFDSLKRLEEVYMSSGGSASGLPLSNWVKAFGALSNIRVLTLCNLSLQYIVVAGANTIREFRNFRHLRELQLLMGMMTDDNLMDIYSFFRLCKCPRLEKLFIELPTTMHDPFMEKFVLVPKEDPPEVDFEFLKIIKVSGFKGHNNEMQLVRFLLEQAGFLESLAVIAFKEVMVEEYNKNIVDGCPDFLHFLQLQLSLCTKASVNAQIILSEHDNGTFGPTHWEVFSKV